MGGRSLGFSLAPLLLAFKIDLYGWQGALLVLAGAGHGEEQKNRARAGSSDPRVQADYC
jgi:hypothetical protein